eukprot:162145_1
MSGFCGDWGQFDLNNYARKLGLVEGFTFNGENIESGETSKCHACMTNANWAEEDPGYPLCENGYEMVPVAGSLSEIKRVYAQGFYQIWCELIDDQEPCDINEYSGWLSCMAQNDFLYCFDLLPENDWLSGVNLAEWGQFGGEFNIYEQENQWFSTTYMSSDDQCFERGYAYFCCEETQRKRKMAKKRHQSHGPKRSMYIKNGKIVRKDTDF